MTEAQLKASILQMAVQGRLVAQDPAEESAATLLARIKKEKQKLIKEGKLKKPKHTSEIYRRDGSFFEKVDGVEGCIDKELPFAIPESWEWVRLGEIATVFGGKRIPAGRKLTEKNTGHIYIRVSDMKDSSVSTEHLLFVPDDIYSTISKYIINKKDVFITVAGTIGRIGKIPCELNGANLTENADRLVFTMLNQDWLIRALQSTFIQGQIAYATTKVGQPKLAIARIEHFLLPLPPLAEQKRIVEKVEELLPLVAEYGEKERALAALDKAFPAAIKKSILQDAVMGRLVAQEGSDESAATLLARIKKEKQKLIKEGKLKKPKHTSEIYRRDGSFFEKVDGVERCIDEEVPFEIPESWEWVRISELSSVVTKGTTPRGGNVAYTNSGIGFLRAENIAGLDKLDLSNLNYINEKTHASYLKRSILQADDFLITIAGTLGRTGIVRQNDLPLNVNQAVAIIRLVDSNSVCLKYLAFALNSPKIQKSLTSQKKITAIPNLTLEIIADCFLPLPPLAEQKRIVQKVEELFAVVGEL